MVCTGKKEDVTDQIEALWNARAPAADAAEAHVSVKAACRAAVEKQLIHGALSLQGKTAVEQADAVLVTINMMVGRVGLEPTT